MAKKPRTPPPPRKVQAPKQRQAPRQGVDPARRRQFLFGAVGAVVVGVAIALIVVFASGGSSKAGNPQAVAATMRAAGCTLTTSPAGPSGEHIAKVTDKVTYTTYPPASGKHYGIPAIWGSYTRTVDPRQAVHNEEHGGIVIWLGPSVSSAERQKVSDFYDSSPNAMLLTPIASATPGITYPAHKAPGSTIYLTAWTVEVKNGEVVNGKDVIAACPRFDEKAFTAFRDEFRGKGPERYKVSDLTPGT
ncbi:MAG: DUF3105 domain-containing protein [Verrucomicrobiota bacterium]